MTFGRRPGAGAARRDGFRGIGGVIAPSLDLSVGGTFTRGSEGSYLTGAPTDGSSAFLAWAGVDVRRIENRGDGLGAMLLMEGSRTNYFLQSRDMTHASWTAGTATLTSNANGGVDGATLADRENASSGQFSAYQQGRGQIAYSTLSAWVRAVSGTVSHQMLMLQAGSTLVAAATSRTTTYGRPSVSGNATGAAGGVPADGRDWSGIGGQVATAQDVYIDLTQVETGYFPSSPIRTAAAAVTRGADVLSYASGSFPAAFLTTGFKVVVAPDASSAEIVSSNTDLRILQVGASDYVRIRKNTNCAVELVCGGSIVATLTVTFSRAQALTITAIPSSGSLTVAGATTGNGTNTGSGAAWPAATTLYVGADNAAGNNFFGRIATTVGGA